MNHGCMFEILGKDEDKSAVLTYRSAKNFLVYVDNNL